MIRDKLTILKIRITKVDRVSTRQLEDKEKVLTNVVEKVAVIRQEEVVQDLTTIPIQTTNNIKIITTVSITKIVALISTRRDSLIMEVLRVYQDNKEVKISFHLSTSVIQNF